MATIHITNIAELQAIESNLSGDYVIDNDITGSISKIRANYFTGTLDGQGYTLTLTISGGAIFNSIDGATIENITFKDCESVGGRACAILCDWMLDTIVTNIRFESCIVTNDERDTAALLAGGDGIYGSSVVSQVYSDDGCIVSAEQFGALLCVQLYGGQISRCAMSGTVTQLGVGSAYMGGIIAYNDLNGYPDGAIRTITNCSSDASIICNSEEGEMFYIGGISGWGGDITNCYFAGTITGGTPIEEEQEEGSVYWRCGICSEQDGTVSSSYWLSTCGASSEYGLGTSKTSTQLKAAATYTGWDFVSTWSIVEGVSYPTLRAFASDITTLAADQVGYAGATARLNGEGGSSYDYVYFQWGQSETSLNRSTSRIAGVASFSQFITGLNPAVVYYFRAVGILGNDLTYGETLSFLSSGAAPVSTTPIGGYQWIEGTDYHYIDASGVERKATGVLV